MFIRLTTVLPECPAYVDTSEIIAVVTAEDRTQILIRGGDRIIAVRESATEVMSTINKAFGRPPVEAE